MTVILDAFNLSYFAVPKVACTSIKVMMFQIENGFAFEPFEANGRKFWIHSFYPTRPFAEIDTTRVANHRRLCVVRDPVRRFLSCYGNRVVSQRELSRPFAGRSLAKAGLPYNPDLSTFITHLRGYMAAVPSIHHHAQPMVDFLGREPAYFARVYRMSELDDFVADVHAASGRSAALDRLQTGGPKIAPEVLTEAQLAFLRDFYAEDYATYGDWL